MKVKQLKALERVIKGTPKRVYCPEKIKYIWCIESYIYACNAVTCVEVAANEYKGDSPTMFEWLPLDIHSCELDEQANRYIDLNRRSNYRFEYPDVSKWGHDYFSRLLENKRLEDDACDYGLDAKQVELVMKVFKAFDIVPRFKGYDNGLVRIYGSDKNYHIRALIMPTRI